MYESKPRTSRSLYTRITLGEPKQDRCRLWWCTIFILDQPLTYDAPRIFALWSRRGTKSGDSFPATARCHPAIIRVTELARVLLSPYSMPCRRDDRSHLGKIESVDKIVGHSNLGESFRWGRSLCTRFPPDIGAKNWEREWECPRRHSSVHFTPQSRNHHHHTPPPSHTKVKERKRERVLSSVSVVLHTCLTPTFQSSLCLDWTSFLLVWSFSLVQSTPRTRSQKHTHTHT